MGYYVTYEGVVDIPAEKRDDIFEALKALNHRHDLKSGGRFGAGTTGDPYEDKWFSWMPPRYHEEVESVEDVLRLLGFEGMEDGAEQHVVYYSDKAGSEDIFLRTIVEAGGSVNIDGSGEDGGLWRWVTVDGRLTEQTGRVVYD